MEPEKDYEQIKIIKTNDDLHLPILNNEINSSFSNKDSFLISSIDE